MNEKRKLTAKDIAECAIFTALIIASAYISIPFYPVPLTFQTAVCVLCGILLGAKKGVAATLCYALIGVLGLPVFSGFKGGIASFLTPTFGYVLGFILSALSAGILSKNKILTYKKAVIVCMIASLACYFIGIIYFIFVWVYLYDGLNSLLVAIFSYNLIYLPKDLALCFLTALIYKKVLPLLK